MLANAGDYEYQTIIVEAMFRMSKDEEKKEYVKDWFPNKTLQQAFYSISTDKFDTVSIH